MTPEEREEAHTLIERLKREPFIPAYIARLFELLMADSDTHFSIHESPTARILRPPKLPTKKE
jgi:hypothetical protein